MTEAAIRTRAPRNNFWAHGEILYLAKESGVSYSTIISILHRVRRASYQVAKKLERATKTMGRIVEACVWVEGFDTDHPAFRPRDIPAEISVNIDKTPTKPTNSGAGYFSLPKAQRKKHARRNMYWACGELRALCEEARISRRVLTMILHRRLRTSYPIALRLENATEAMKRAVDRHTWLDNLGSTHPAFSGEPVERSRRPDMMSVNIDKKEATHA